MYAIAMVKDNSGTKSDSTSVQDAVPSAAVAADQGVHLGDPLKTIAKPDDFDATKAGIILEQAFDDFARVNGIPEIPRAQKEMMVSAGMSRLREAPAAQRSGLSASSGLVMDAVKAGFSVAYGSLTDEQRREMRLQQAMNQAGGGGSIDAKGRVLIDGVTGYGDRDGRKTDSKERRSSAEYDKMAGGAVDRAIYSTLINEGFTRQQINDAAFTAQALGWKDRQSIKNLTHAGKEFSTLAEQYDRASRDGDAAKMAATMQKMHDQRDHAYGKKRAGMTGIIDKFDKLNATKADNRIQSKSEQKAPSAQADKDQKAIYEALKKKQAAAVSPGH